MARILVVDDEVLLRKLVRKMLEEVGHQVAEATNGNEALAMVERTPPDLVIMDVLMPEREGIETIASLRRAKSAIPILAISGGGRTRMTEFLTVAEKFGAQGSLRKPFDQKALLDAVQNLLGKAGPPPQNRP